MQLIHHADNGVIGRNFLRQKRKAGLLPPAPINQLPRPHAHRIQHNNPLPFVFQIRRDRLHNQQPLPFQSSVLHSRNHGSHHAPQKHVCLLLSAFCLLLSSAFCLLLSAFCSLPSALCLLPSALCLLPSAFCLLLSAFCLLLSFAFCLLAPEFYLFTVTVSTIPTTLASTGLSLHPSAMRAELPDTTITVSLDPAPTVSTAIT